MGFDSKHPLYRIWRKMLREAKEQNVHISFHWNEFKNFCNDMGEKGGKNKYLTRLNNSDGFHPMNCAWMTSKEQIKYWTK